MGRCPLFILLAALIGIILISDSSGFSRPEEPPFYGRADYSGYLLEVKEASTSGNLALALIDSINGNDVKAFKTRIHIVSDYPEIISGQRICISGNLKPLPLPAAIPDAIDFHAGLRRKGTVASLTAATDSVKYVASTKSLRHICAKANNAILNRLKQCPLKSETIDILAAMLLGRGELLTDTTRLTYSAAGLSHLLALSGVHVGFIAMIISFALWPLYLGRHVRTRMLFTIIALWLYAAFTGFLPSVTRAVIMASVYMFGRVLQRKSPPLNSLCLAAIIILLFSPGDLYSVGFQLSFSAVLGIIVFYPIINRVDRHEHPLMYAMASYPALSVSAMMLTGIVAAFRFHTYPLYFIIANLAAIPIMPMLIFSGVISLIFEARFLSDFFVNVLDFIANETASLTGAVVDGLYAPAWYTLALVILLSVAGLAYSQRSRFVMCLSVILIIGISVCRLVAPRTIYPQHEEYIVNEYRSTQTIVSTGDTCYIYTDAKLKSDRDEIMMRYEIMLRDFMAKRNLVGPIMISN